MKKWRNIVYWVATAWLGLGMVSTGIVQLMKREEEVTFIVDLGYPAYLLPMLGVWKILGAITVIVPGITVLKEWAYAGFFFAMSGAIYSHLAKGEAVSEIFPSLLLLVLTILSWYFRPTTRKVATLNI